MPAGIGVGAVTLPMGSRWRYHKEWIHWTAPSVPLRMSSAAWMRAGSERCWVPACTIRLYLRAASMDLRPSQMQWLTGFST